jgi:HD-GYP domain-containing protein (c-di-GMP phosphodiesterase class II)
LIATTKVDLCDQPLKISSFKDEKVEMIKKTKPNAARERLEVLQSAAIDLISTHDLQQILGLILKRACHLLTCDAGSVYVKHSKNELMFEATTNSSLQTDFQRRVLSTSENKGLAVFSFNNKLNLNIPDVYEIPEHSPYQFDQTFDRRVGYRTRSVLVQPLVSRKGEVIGVLQMINRKNKNSEAWPSQNEKKISNMPTFSADDIKTMATFAALATAALENALLYEKVEKLFEGFVNAAVKAIEARDPTTSGHSERVALLSVDLAEKTNRCQIPGLKGVQFSNEQIRELRFAALLHDFGKIGVNEGILQKSKKLSAEQYATIKYRISEFTHVFEIDELRRTLDKYRAGSLNEIELARAEKSIQNFKTHLQDCWQVINNLNEPTVLTEDLSKQLEQIKAQSFLNANRAHQPLIDADELFHLSIPQGSLSADERREIESHVTHTFFFLKDIPWTWGLDALPEIAYAHHEKLDGTGYPRRLTGNEIPVQSQLMTICDIFDALVAKDRPYKKSLPAERALDIIARDARNGKLNADLFKVFVEAEVYKNAEFYVLSQKKAA